MYDIVKIEEMIVDVKNRYECEGVTLLIDKEDLSTILYLLEKNFSVKWNKYDQNPMFKVGKLKIGNDVELNLNLIISFTPNIVSNKTVIIIPSKK